MHLSHLLCGRRVLHGFEQQVPSLRFGLQRHHLDRHRSRRCAQHPWERLRHLGVMHRSHLLRGRRVLRGFERQLPSLRLGVERHHLDRHRIGRCAQHRWLRPNQLRVMHLSHLLCGWRVLHGFELQQPSLRLGVERHHLDRHRGFRSRGHLAIVHLGHLLCSRNVLERSVSIARSLDRSPKRHAPHDPWSATWCERNLRQWKCRRFVERSRNGWRLGNHRLRRHGESRRGNVHDGWCAELHRDRPRQRDLVHLHRRRY